MITLAPILLFTYKRLDTLRKTVSALQDNYLASESELYIFSDAAKKEEDRPIINEVRSFLRSISGFKKISIIEAQENKGLANSIISGVSEVLKQYESVIVLEDDLITTPNFLTFMNQALNEYSSQPEVFSISGYSFDLGSNSSYDFDAYFLNRGWSWGWATWKDRWGKVDWEVKDYSQFKRNRSSRKAFAKGGSDLNKMLKHQMQGKLDSWAIRWFYHQYKVEGLTLYPILSIVSNNGFDALATHTNGSDKRYIPLMDKKASLEFRFPNTVEINPYYQGRFQQKMGIFSRIRSKLETQFLRFTK